MMALLFLGLIAFSVAFSLLKSCLRLCLSGRSLLRRWINTMEINDPQLARLICRLIPVACPFERDLTLFGKTIVHIPPLCKLNPFYEETVSLRFRALCYLADDCGEDISCYC